MKTLADGTKILKTECSFEDASGWFLRGYNEERQEYQMLDSHFDEHLPRWVESVKHPLVEGKGIPTALYLDLLTMKRFKLTPKYLKKIIICEVHEWDSVFHFTNLRRNSADASLAELFRETRLFMSRQNVIIQTGLKVLSVRFNPTKIRFCQPFELLSKGYAISEEEIRALCEKYLIHEQDMVYWNFDIEIIVAPITA
ncbi:MAG: hypothetical protein ACPGJS_09925 [Flammeovirgaceae bacterium]